MSRMFAIAVVGSLVLITNSAPACTIPVFRFALERWESDRYQVIVFYDQPFTEEQAAAVKKLTQQSVEEGGPLNIEVIPYDLRASEPPKLLEAERPSSNQSLPLVELRTRTAVRNGQAHWTRRWQGSFDDALSQPGLFDSPARQEIVRRILDGHAAVWLLVTTNDDAKQKSTELQMALDDAARNIPLPQGIGLPGSELYSSVPLELRFSVLSISHQDVAERRFLELLAGGTSEWKQDATYVVPVFGRGRALDVMPLADLEPATIQDIAGFICGACSCQVKQANPGFDLLISANWEDKLFGASDAENRATDSSVPSSAIQPRSTSEAEASLNPEYLQIPTGQNPAVPQDEPRAAKAIATTAVAHPPKTTQTAASEVALFSRIPGVGWLLLAIGGLALAIGAIAIGISRGR